MMVGSRYKVRMLGSSGKGGYHRSDLAGVQMEPCQRSILSWSCSEQQACSQGLSPRVRLHPRKLLKVKALPLLGE